MGFPDALRRKPLLDAGPLPGPRAQPERRADALAAGHRTVGAVQLRGMELAQALLRREGQLRPCLRRPPRRRPALLLSGKHHRIGRRQLDERHRQALPKPFGPLHLRLQGHLLPRPELRSERFGELPERQAVRILPGRGRGMGTHAVRVHEADQVDRVHEDPRLVRSGGQRPHQQPALPLPDDHQGDDRHYAVGRLGRTDRGARGRRQPHVGEGQEARHRSRPPPFRRTVHHDRRLLPRPPRRHLPAARADSRLRGRDHHALRQRRRHDLLGRRRQLRVFPAHRQERALHPARQLHPLEEQDRQLGGGHAALSLPEQDRVLERRAAGIRRAGSVQGPAGRGHVARTVRHGASRRHQVQGRERRRRDHRRRPGAPVRLLRRPAVHVRLRRRGPLQELDAQRAVQGHGQQLLPLRRQGRLEIRRLHPLQPGLQGQRADAGLRSGQPLDLGRILGQQGHGEPPRALPAPLLRQQRQQHQTLDLLEGQRPLPAPAGAEPELQPAHAGTAQGARPAVDRLPGHVREPRRMGRSGHLRSRAGHGHGTRLPHPAPLLAADLPDLLIRNLANNERT